MSEDQTQLVDESLVDATLAMTVRERLQQNDRMIRMALRLREAFGQADTDDDEPSA
jgi:hypothetical protein